MTIKIKNIEAYKDTIACKGKIVFLWGDCREERFYKYGIESHDKTQFATPVIISEIEKYMVGDKVKNNYNEIVDYTEELEKIYGKQNSCFTKILALTHNFSPDHLQLIKDGQLKDGDDVFVECEKTFENDVIDDGGKYIEFSEYQIRLNNNHVNIFKIDSNQGWNDFFDACHKWNDDNRQENQYGNDYWTFATKFYNPPIKK